nr:MAG TPA_asm: hypothetical protein [Caudoviricetes sp.]
MLLLFAVPLQQKRNETYVHFPLCGIELLESAYNSSYRPVCHELPSFLQKFRSLPASTLAHSRKNRN